MKKGISAIAAILCFSLAILARPQAVIRPPSTSSPKWAAMQWLQLLDSGNYTASWNKAAPPFQSRISKSKWIAGMKKVRAHYGKVVSRKLEGLKYVNPGGFPTGEHAVLQYATNLARRGRVAEVLSMIMHDDGVWRVSSYYVVPLYRAL